MNKHTAINENTGRVYTRNSKTKIYAFAVVLDFRYADGTVGHEVLGGPIGADSYALWTSRADLAEKIVRKLTAEYGADRIGSTIEISVLPAMLNGSTGGHY